MQNVCYGHCVSFSKRFTYSVKGCKFLCELSLGKIPLQLLYLASNDYDPGLN